MSKLYLKIFAVIVVPMFVSTFLKAINDKAYIRMFDDLITITVIVYKDRETSHTIKRHEKADSKS